MSTNEQSSEKDRQKKSSAMEDEGQNFSELPDDNESEEIKYWEEYFEEDEEEFRHKMKRKSKPRGKFRDKDE